MLLTGSHPSPVLPASDGLAFWQGHHASGSWADSALCCSDYHNSNEARRNHHLRAFWHRCPPPCSSSVGALRQLSFPSWLGGRMIPLCWPMANGWHCCMHKGTLSTLQVQAHPTCLYVLDLHRPRTHDPGIASLSPETIGSCGRGNDATQKTHISPLAIAVPGGRVSRVSSKWPGWRSSSVVATR